MTASLVPKTKLENPATDFINMVKYRELKNIISKGMGLFHGGKKKGINSVRGVLWALGTEQTAQYKGEVQIKKHKPQQGQWKKQPEEGEQKVT